MLKKSSFKSLIAALVFIVAISAGIKLYAAYVGQAVNSLQLIDVYDNPKAMPYIGQKVISIMYTDPDVKDVNDPLSNAMDAKKYDKTNFAQWV